jgi:hypothetical protein
MLAVDVYQLVGSGTPVVLAAGFAVIMLLRRRDRRRPDADDA